VTGRPESRASHVVKPSGGIYLEPVNPPEESWWTQADRVTFQRRLVEETPRMTSSRFGRLIRISDKGLWE
jgi:hypothetical protein